MLTQQEQTALRAIRTREGGIDALMDLIRNLDISDKKSAAVVALGAAVSVTVSDWQTPAQYIAKTNFDRGEMLAAVVQDINAAVGAHDQGKLGPLFVQLYAAVKAKFNL